MTRTTVSSSEAKMIQRLLDYRKNTELHAAQCLKVITKEAALLPLILNKPQQIIHAKLEEQRAQHGLVRAIILKGRKQGASTYIAGRFYSKTRLYKYRNAKVMAHVQDSTNALFSMVKTMYDNDPIRLRADTSNAKQFTFSNQSSYTVATAGGAGESGRGDTPTLAHLSEVAFYKDAAKNFAGFANSVPMAPETEVVVESTANGIGNEFHRRWVRAESGLTETVDGGAVSYIPIFIPWFWSDEYQLPVHPKFELRTDPEGDGMPSERDIFEMHDLTLPQMAWRRFQLEESLGTVEKFMQEYPCTPSEAFQTPGLDLFIKPVYVMRARRRDGIIPYGPKILGVDPNGEGSDQFSTTFRQGHVVHWTKNRTGLDPGEEQVEFVKDLIVTHQIDRVNIDYGGGYGTALMQGLREKYPALAEKCFYVDFGGKSQFKMVKPHAPGPRNRRAEMYMRGRDWFENPEGVSIPDEDELQSDLGQVCARIGGQSTDTVIEPKIDIKKRLGRSPDTADSFVLTFAVPDGSVESGLTETPTSSSVAFEQGIVPKETTPPPESNWGNGGLGFDSGGGWMG